MGVQSQNSGNSSFYDRNPYFTKILARPLLFVKRGCMFFCINVLPQNWGGLLRLSPTQIICPPVRSPCALKKAVGESAGTLRQAITSVLEVAAVGNTRILLCQGYGGTRGRLTAQQERDKNVERPTPNAELRSYFTSIP